MKVVETVGGLRALTRGWRAAGESIALVPTMGALHEGHLSLVRAARERDSRVVASIFVNPLQFGPGEDLDAYPRPFEDDRRLLEEAQVDVLFHPGTEEMYPPGADTRVVPGSVAVSLEGRARPHHFAGVATVVARLLGAATPDRAYFGQKDAQQLAVVRAMVRDLAIPVEIVACPTVREADGLAMSSRNRYLDARAREAAPALIRALASAQARFLGGETDGRELAAGMRRELRQAGGVEYEYAAVVDPKTFETGPDARAGSLALIAARVGPARLIDNAFLGEDDLLRYLSPEPQAEAASPSGADGLALMEVPAWNA